MNKIKLTEDRWIGESEFPFIIAEIGNNHNGDLNLAFKMIKIAKEIGIDAVKFQVKDVEEGTGKYEGSLGALVCEGTDTGKFIKVNVGSGITDEQRDEFWKQKKDIIGNIVEIRADVISKNQDDDHYSLRFPRFLSFRGFATGEKI